MISIQEYKALSKVFSNLEVSQDKTLNVETLKNTDIQLDINDILEGIYSEIRSSDGSQILYNVQDLKETLKPEFDDEDYEDSDAKKWEEFINALVRNNIDYLIVISEH